MFLLETKNLTKIVKGYNKKSELHVSPAGVRVGASASLRVSCVGTSRHQKGTKAPSKCFKCYTLLRPIICITLNCILSVCFRSGHSRIRMAPWDACDTCRGLWDTFCPSVCYLYITYHSYRYYILSFRHLQQPCDTGDTFSNLAATTLVTRSASSFFPF